MLHDQGQYLDIARWRYYRYLAQWSDSDTTLVVLAILQQCGYTLPVWNDALLELRLRAVCALVHYIPYSTCRGVSTITNNTWDY